jgi:hypothetical protein
MACETSRREYMGRLSVTVFTLATHLYKKDWNRMVNLRLDLGVLEDQAIFDFRCLCDGINVDPGPVDDLEELVPE